MEVAAVAHWHNKFVEHDGRESTYTGIPRIEGVDICGLREAAEDATFVLKTDAELTLPEHGELKRALDRFLAKSCTL